MTKTCDHCGRDFYVIEGIVIPSPAFCSVACEREYFLGASCTEEG